MKHIINTDLLNKKISQFLNAEDYYLSTKNNDIFEQNLQRFFGVQNAISVSSGTAALHCSLIACNIKEGDEILVPAISVPMSISPILYLKAKPIFVDSNLENIDFDYEDLENKITIKTKGILAVYMWGCSYNIDKLLAICKRNNLFLIEDTCQSFGSRWKKKYLGTIGDLGCFSLKDGKIISSGEGGFILTNNFELASKCKNLRSHFSTSNYTQIGYNYRLSEIQALIANFQLTYISKILKYRKKQANYLINHISKFDNISPYKYYKEETSNLFSPLFFLNNQNFDFFSHLSDIGILNSVGSFNFCPVYRRKMISELYPNIFCKNSEKFVSKLLSLILLPNYSFKDLDLIINKISNLI
ncbi:MAG: hypothetical protein A2X61_00820 [Ignavibacteria bacterium GWB2_35_12]|nr:MAG: hypothetical protein A2X61_00820 [Ignavibacteria bacterium GWB2_35_12]OGU87544.1 MAG: hypothetical protein A2220_15580 [Ignavibacteria bacterium RIFOXYA2_FULL_35_10]OGV21735.1 MAG: hypothetical protein A2475_04045 [Ignavibacteria bacterium RIFOXYC2_FULL_35_21]